MKGIARKKKQQAGHDRGQRKCNYAVGNLNIIEACSPVRAALPVRYGETAGENERRTERGIQDPSRCSLNSGIINEGKYEHVSAHPSAYAPDQEGEEEESPKIHVRRSGKGTQHETCDGKKTK